MVTTNAYSLETDGAGGCDDVYDGGGPAMTVIGDAGYCCVHAFEAAATLNDRNKAETAKRIGTPIYHDDCLRGDDDDYGGPRR